MKETDKQKIWPLIEALAIDWLVDNPSVADDDLLRQIELAMEEVYLRGEPEQHASLMLKHATRRMTQLVGQPVNDNTKAGVAVVLLAVGAIICPIRYCRILAAWLFTKAADFSPSYFDAHQHEPHNIIIAKLPVDAFLSDNNAAVKDNQKKSLPQTIIYQNFMDGSTNTVLANSEIKLNDNDRQQD